MVGTAVSCSAMMFSLFPALLGTVGAWVSSSMPGMPGVASTPTSALPGWVQLVTQYAPEILAVSVVLMIWAVWSASRVVKVLVGLGIVLWWSTRST